MTQAVGAPAAEAPPVIRGQVGDVIAKGPGRWQIAVTPEGSQYPKNLWTKDEALVQDLMQQRGQWFDFRCGISHWKMQDGTPVKSLWINAVGAYGTMQEAPQAGQPGGQLPGAAPGVMVPQAQQQPTTAYPPGYPAPQQPPAAQQPAPQPALAVPLPQEVKELRIMRQTATKVAAFMLPYLPQEQQTPVGLEAIAEWLVRYYTGGPQHHAQAAQGASSAPAAAQGNSPVQGDPGPEQGDPGPGDGTGGWPV